jgi:hypothetical protein
VRPLDNKEASFCAAFDCFAIINQAAQIGSIWPRLFTVNLNLFGK